MDENKIDKNKTKNLKNKLSILFMIFLNLSYIFVVIGISRYFQNKWIVFGIGLFFYSIFWIAMLDDSDTNKI